MPAGVARLQSRHDPPHPGVHVSRIGEAVTKAIANIPHRSEVVDAWKERGGRIAAVLPIHYPRALLRAFDFLPMEVWGPNVSDPTLGAGHLQSYVCAIVHRALSFIEGGGSDAADMILIPHTCDSMQGLGSILTDFVDTLQPIIPFYIPRGNRESDIEFLSGEFRSLFWGLERMTGRSPAEEDLLECVEREEEADRYLAELYFNRRDLKHTDLDFYRLLRGREYLPAEIFSEIAGGLLDGVDARSGPAGGPEDGATEGTAEGFPERLPLLLSGIVPEPMALFDLIAETGGHVVADDLACCSRRLYPAGTGEDPFTRMATSILEGPPDPTRGSSLPDRIAHIKRLAGESGAKGVVFYTVKFCEPELFDLPVLRSALTSDGIPSLIIESDLGDAPLHRVRTQLEAFMEVVG